jgi:hypothetical protein
MLSEQDKMNDALSAPVKRRGRPAGSRNKPKSRFNKRVDISAEPEESGKWKQKSHFNSKSVSLRPFQCSCGDTVMAASEDTIGVVCPQCLMGKVQLIPGALKPDGTKTEGETELKPDTIVKKVKTKTGKVKHVRVKTRKRNYSEETLRARSERMKEMWKTRRESMGRKKKVK